MSKTIQEQLKAIRQIGLGETKNNNKVMTFGNKYYGVDLCEVPSTYLTWVLGRDIKETLRATLEMELASRGK